MNGAADQEHVPKLILAAVADVLATANRCQHGDEQVRVAHESADLIGRPADVGVDGDGLGHERGSLT
jgi:hypothetical protein